MERFWKFILCKFTLLLHTLDRISSFQIILIICQLNVLLRKCILLSSNKFSKTNFFLSFKNLKAIKKPFFKFTFFEHLCESFTDVLEWSFDEDSVLHFLNCFQNWCNKWLVYIQPKMLISGRGGNGCCYKCSWHWSSESLKLYGHCFCTTGFWTLRIRQELMLQHSNLIFFALYQSLRIWIRRLPLNGFTCQK